MTKKERKGNIRTHCKGKPSWSGRTNSMLPFALEGSSMPLRFPLNHMENSAEEIKRRKYLSLLHRKIHRSSRLKRRFSGMKAGQQLFQR